VAISYAKADQDTGGFPVYTYHQRYMPVLLHAIVLVNADLIGPKQPWTVTSAELQKSDAQAFRYLNGMVIANDYIRACILSPYVRQSFEWTF